MEPTYRPSNPSGGTSASIRLALFSFGNFLDLSLRTPPPIVSNSTPNRQRDKDKKTNKRQKCSSFLSFYLCLVVSRVEFDILHTPKLVAYR